ncbi:MAG: polysaccharide biosynthesis C-terminal domain-containing protein, partial [Anaerolineales bacterium]|nr:polysaccharide biosynthesis C-terminal domain-containing protein [Anaerolineales bacterium]
RMYTTDTHSLSRLMSKSFNLLLILSVPIGLGLIVVADQLVVLLFGPEFVNSGPVLAMFGLVLILTYQNMLLGQFLVSTDRQNKWTVVMIVAAIVTIPLDLTLIPWCVQTFANGAVGGAAAFVITEAGMMIAGLSLLPKGSLTRANASMAVRILLAGLTMFAAASLVRESFIAVPILVGAIVYGLLARLLRAVADEDVTLLLEIAQRLRSRIRHKSKPAETVGTS